jgi:hypothetical protein
MFRKKFPPLLVRVIFQGRIDTWRWDGKKQTLLFRGKHQPEIQPKLSRSYCKVRGRKFYLEEGMEPIEVRMDPEGDGMFVFPREP